MLPAPHFLTVDNRPEPVGISPTTPRFGWQLGAAVAQDACDIEVFEALGGAGVWRSGPLERREPFGVGYGGPALRPRTAYNWRVRVRSGGEFSAWSEPAGFETGLGDRPWNASWISAPGTGGKGDTAALHLRTLVDLPAAVVRGRAYVSALGWYRLFVNDHDVTGDDLVPRWTPFHDYVEYQAYDVTKALSAGANRIGMIVAEGRFRGKLGAFARPRIYGNRLAAIAQFVLDLADGTTIVVGTDGTWLSTTGRTITSDPMTGDRADLRIPESGWLDPAWPATPVEVLAHEARRLEPEEVQRVTAVGRLEGVVTRTPAGVQLVDFGQNFAGVARLRLAGPAGATAKLLYGEVLSSAGELATDYLSIPGGDKSQWFQRDEVTLAGDPMDYRAALTIHGFRYVAIEGPVEPLDVDDVEGIVLSTPLEEISEFSASDPRLEKLWSNVRWSLRSNFTDTPTDCPTRERSGWTGDIQVFGGAAVQLVDAHAYLSRYLRNVALEQHDDGRVPPFIPAEQSPGLSRNPLGFTSSSAGWGDVTVLLPWTMYNYYGDAEVLRRQYASAKAWVDGLAKRARTRIGLRRLFGRRVGRLERFIVDTGYHWGEWLRPGETLASEMPGNLLGKRAAVATAYLAASSAVLARIAETLGESADAARYEGLAVDTAAAWRAAFVREGGSRIGADKQDDYVRALAFNLIDPADRGRAAARLAALVEEADYHLGTGFLSTPMLLETLVDAGYADHAMRILRQDTAPSWFDQIARGATTIWETWAGVTPGGEPSASQNHYAFGAVVAFLQERVAGLAPAEPGYRRLRIAPVVGYGLTSASTAIRTPYGRAAVAWRMEDTNVHLDVTVPAGATAEVVVGDDTRDLGPGRHLLEFQLPT
jgi:alpha-L-rhamnosidase